MATTITGAVVEWLEQDTAIVEYVGTDDDGNIKIFDEEVSEISELPYIVVEQTNENTMFTSGAQYLEEVTVKLTAWHYSDATANAIKRQIESAFNFPDGCTLTFDDDREKFLHFLKTAGGSVAADVRDQNGRKVFGKVCEYNVLTQRYRARGEP